MQDALQRQHRLMHGTVQWQERDAQMTLWCLHLPILLGRQHAGTPPPAGCQALARSAGLCICILGTRQMVASIEFLAQCNEQ